MSRQYEKEEMEPVLKSSHVGGTEDSFVATTAVPLVTANFIERDDAHVITVPGVLVATELPSSTSSSWFSTSICGLFQNPYSRSDCCALNCCGLLSLDRTRYLATKEQPTWIRRILLYIVLPWVSMQLFNILIFYYSATNENLAGNIAFLALVIYIVWFSYFLFIARAYRRETREIVLRKIYQNGVGSQVNTQQGELEFIRLHAYETERAHPCCCGKYPVAYDATPMPNKEEFSKDFCSCLWYTGYRMCGLCQCCGLCAIAQEEREINRLVSPEERSIDYVTFQPHDGYYSEINALRSQRNYSLMAHFRAISNLSSKLLKALAIYLAITLVFALFDLSGSALGKMSVLLATFGQAFLVLFFVHWQWHRFDLSVDAVIKYFAYGFLLTTGITLFFETLISFVINVVFFIINIVSLISYLESSPISKPEDVYDLIASFAKTHQWIFILYFFANAFVVAALVEETTKYFAFWSMEHPDFSEILSPPDRRAILRRNRESYGAAITVAMVAAATGFACCEDLGYIFSPSSTVQDEIVTLLIRSLFPVHQICAAIQSIGVCRRELEGQKEWTLGKCILPAVLLHGLFDFVIFVTTFEYKLWSPNSTQQDDQNNKVNVLSDDAAWMNENGSVNSLFIFLNLGLPFLIAAAGFVYYWRESRLQTSRLKSLDAQSNLSNQVDAVV